MTKLDKEIKEQLYDPENPAQMGKLKGIMHYAIDKLFDPKRHNPKSRQKKWRDELKAKAHAGKKLKGQQRLTSAVSTSKRLDEFAYDSKVPYVYLTSCVDSTAEKIDAMKDKAKEISYSYFIKTVGIDVIKEMFPYYAWSGKGLKLKDDYAVSYYKSVYDGIPVAYMVHSAIEYIFAPVSECAYDIKGIKAWLKKKGIEPDTIDVEGEYDHNLSHTENLEHFKAIISATDKDIHAEVTKSAACSHAQRLKEQIKAIEDKTEITDMKAQLKEEKDTCKCNPDSNACNHTATIREEIAHAEEKAGIPDLKEQLKDVKTLCTCAECHQMGLYDPAPRKHKREVLLKIEGFESKYVSGDKWNKYPMKLTIERDTDNPGMDMTYITLDRIYPFTKDVSRILSYSHLTQFTTFKIYRQQVEKGYQIDLQIHTTRFQNNVNLVISFVPQGQDMFAVYFFENNEREVAYFETNEEGYLQVEKLQKKHAELFYDPAALKITGTKSKMQRLKKHLEKEHPSTKGHMRIYDPKMTKIGEKYIIEAAPYESHRRGKNYGSQIKGLHPKYIFERVFLPKGGEHGQYLLGEKPKAGDIFELKAIYYSGGGSPSPNSDSGFYELQKDGSFVKIKESDVKDRFKVQLEETFDPAPTATHPPRNWFTAMYKGIVKRSDVTNPAAIVVNIWKRLKPAKRAEIADREAKGERFHYDLPLPDDRPTKGVGTLRMVKPFHLAEAQVNVSGKDFDAVRRSGIFKPMRRNDGSTCMVARCKSKTPVNIFVDRV